jgi:hypothetical protein
MADPGRTHRSAPATRTENRQGEGLGTLPSFIKNANLYGLASVPAHRLFELQMPGEMSIRKLILRLFNFFVGIFLIDQPFASISLNNTNCNEKP